MFTPEFTAQPGAHSAHRRGYPVNSRDGLLYRVEVAVDLLVDVWGNFTSYCRRPGEMASKSHEKLCKVKLGQIRELK
jgi:hypothetical protein